MRIVGGRLRGKGLSAPEDHSIRPTSDRGREALFNLLQQGRVAGGRDRVQGARVLDAFAGSGALGIEALSRGAASAAFMERDPAAIALIRRNLRTCGLVAQGQVYLCDACRPPSATQPCNLILLDPPYEQGLLLPALLALGTAGWIAEEATIAAEVATKEAAEVASDCETAGFSLADERRYGRATLLFLTRALSDQIEPR